MPYYTRTGDKGKTSTAVDRRIQKDSLLIETLGNYDELNSAIGVAASFTTDGATRQTLEHIQNDLHTVCAEISGKGSEVFPTIKKEHIRELEEAVNRIELKIGQQHAFLIPGGTHAASLIHLSRSIARRAERSLVRLSRKSKIREELLTYSNRLSTLLYVLARLQNLIAERKETIPKYRHQK